MKGRMAMSSTFRVEFDFKTQNSIDKIKAASGLTDFGSSSLISLFCNEAQLPNVSAATGSQTGRILGETQINYATGRIFTDISLGWYCDKDMTPLKFLNAWNDYIFSSKNEEGGHNSIMNKVDENSLTTANIGTRNFEVRLRYPDDYQATIKITKTEDNKAGTNESKTMTYYLLDAFPYSIDATPLSYGSSQLVNVSASFYYSKFFINHT